MFYIIIVQTYSYSFMHLCDYPAMSPCGHGVSARAVAIKQYYKCIVILILIKIHSYN